MDLLNIIALAIALAMDAFAVAIATGVRLKRVSLRQFFRLAWHFGLFQAMMPVMGWAAGLTVRVQALSDLDRRSPATRPPWPRVALRGSSARLAR